MRRMIENIILFISFFLIVHFTGRLIKNYLIAALICALLSTLVLFIRNHVKNYD
jgi:hypothetical protein